MVPACGEAHRVVFVDGIWLGRDVVMFVACTKDHVVGWHSARSERAAERLASFSSWRTRRDGFLEEKTVVDGRPRYKHERLRRARRGLEKLARAGTPFACLDGSLLEGGPVPATNNRMEGGANRQPRIMLGEHKGPDVDRRIEAVFWRCCLHTECPLPASGILRKTPMDETTASLHRQASDAHGRDGLIEQWGTAIQWNDLHMDGTYRINY